eukprot:3456039-Amphidinium_carterae.1
MFIPSPSSTFTPQHRYLLFTAPNDLKKRFLVSAAQQLTEGKQFDRCSVVSSSGVLKDMAMQNSGVVVRFNDAPCFLHGPNATSPASPVGRREGIRIVSYVVVELIVSGRMPKRLLRFARHIFVRAGPDPEEDARNIDVLKKSFPKSNIRYLGMDFLR